MSKQPDGFTGIKLEGIDLLLTYRCTGKCAVCTYNCSPGAKIYLDEEMALSVLANAAAHPLKWVLLFGGEPFLVYDLLVRLTGLAARLVGAPVSIFTNAYFATSRKRAKERLKPLVDAGLARLNLSIDVYHAAFVPPERVANAAQAADELGLKVYVDAILPPFPDRGKAEKRETVRLINEFEAITRIPVRAEPYRLTGRAAELGIYGPAEELSKCLLPSYLGSELAAPYGVEVHPGGDICLCAGLSLGNLKDHSLNEILAAYDPGRHPIIGPLLKGGPMALLQMAAGLGLLEPRLITTPMSRCQACHLARKALLNEFPGELSPTHCYSV